MEALGIDLKLLIAQIVNFAIFYFVFKKFIAQPLLAYLKTQQEGDVRRHELQSELTHTEEKLEGKKKTMLAEVKKKQTEMIDEAKQAAQAASKDILTQAQKQAADIISSGKQAVESQKQTLEKEVSESIRKVAQTAVEKGFASYLSAPMQKAIIQQILKNV